MKKIIYRVAFVLLLALAILGLVENRAAERAYNSSSNLSSSLVRTQCNEKMGFTVCFPSNRIVEEDAGGSNRGDKSLRLTSPEEPKSEVTVYNEANTYGTVRADEIIKKKGAEKIGERKSKNFSYNWMTWSEYASKTIEGIDIYGVVFVADNRIYEMQFSNRRKKEDLTEDENRIIDTFYFPISSHRNQELGFSIEYPTGSGWVADEENSSADKSLRLMSPAIAKALAGKGGVSEDVEEVGPDMLVTNRVNIYGAIGSDKIIAKRGGKKIGDIETTFGWKGADYLGKDKKGSDIYCALFEESGRLYEIQFSNREKKEEVTELEKMALNSFISEQSLEEVSKKWAVADKPVIYLYPQAPQDVKVSLDFDGTLTATYPDYRDGWDVFAYPDGRLINSVDRREYSYLFWEGILSEGVNYDFNQGFVIAGKYTAGFLQDKLSQMGLTPKEYNEFIVYWMPKMQDNRYNLIHFASKEEYDDHARLTIEPKPDSILRVFMAYKPLEEKWEVKAQEIKPFVRNGFTVVEWGGTEIK